MEAGSKLTKAIESLNWSLSERDTFAQLTRHNNCEKFRDHSQIPLLWNLIGMIRVSQQQYLVIYVVLPNTHTWTCPTEFTDCLEYNHTHTHTHLSHCCLSTYQKMLHYYWCQLLMMIIYLCCYVLIAMYIWNWQCPLKNKLPINWYNYINCFLQFIDWTF